MNPSTIPIALLNALEKFVERRAHAEGLAEMDLLRRLVSESAKLHSSDQAIALMLTTRLHPT